VSRDVSLGAVRPSSYVANSSLVPTGMWYAVGGMWGKVFRKYVLYARGHPFRVAYHEPCLLQWLRSFLSWFWTSKGHLRLDLFFPVVRSLMPLPAHQVVFAIVILFYTE
jgi:hypothetical protein